MLKWCMWSCRLSAGIGDSLRNNFCTLVAETRIYMEETLQTLVKLAFEQLPRLHSKVSGLVSFPTETIDLIMLTHPLFIWSTFRGTYEENSVLCNAAVDPRADCSNAAAAQAFMELISWCVVCCISSAWVNELKFASCCYGTNR